MAIYHCTTKPIRRSAGRSAVAAAAYRSGECLTDDRTGNKHDYTRRQGVVSTVALLPTGESCNRSELWNAAESAEKRKDARTAREWVVALPSELDEQQRLQLATGFAVELGKRYGVAVDVAIHLPDKEGDQRNHHAHILTTTRKTEMQGGKLVMLDKATLELSDKKRGELKLGKAKEEVKRIRALWADMANGYLQEAGHAERIDHRTLKEQGVDKVASVHLGPTATQMERNGKASDRGSINREIKKVEAEIISLKAERERRILQAKKDLVTNNPEKVVAQYESQRKTIVVRICNYYRGIANEVAEKFNAAQKRTGELYQQQPKPPRKGLFSILKQRAYEKDYKAWFAENAAAEKERQALQQKLIGQDLTTFDSSPNRWQATKADKLADQEMIDKFPELVEDWKKAREVIREKEAMQATQQTRNRKPRKPRSRSSGR